mgnify:CR=1 FL=1
MTRFLTKAEEQVMKILWKLEKGFVHDIIEKMPHPKPAYNTVSTIVRILVKKGFVGYEAFGKTHQYHPLVDKDKYSKFFLSNFIGGYFGGSFQNMVSFFAKENDMDVNELDELLSKVKQNLKDQDD